MNFRASPKPDSPRVVRAVRVVRAGGAALRLLLLVVLVVGWLPGTARAHNPDTSYARVRIFPDRLELRLTFDVVTLQQIVPTLDANADRALSRAELVAGTAAAREFLTGHVFLRLDGRDVPLGVAGEPFWPLDATDPLPADQWHEVSALISLPFDTHLEARPKTVELGFAVFDQLGERHTVLGNFEAGGAPVPVVFNIAEPDFRYAVPPALPPAPAQAAVTPPPLNAGTPAAPGKAERPTNGAGAPAADWLGQGLVWTGVCTVVGDWPSVCLVIALLLVSRPRTWTGTVAACALGHGLTTAATAAGMLRLPPAFAHWAVAASILYVALENLWRIARGGAVPRVAFGENFSTAPRESNLGHRWPLALACGLLLGLRSGLVLQAHPWSRDGFGATVGAFNFGSFLGVLAVVLVLLALDRLAGPWPDRPKLRGALSIAISFLAIAWLGALVWGLVRAAWRSR